MRWTWIALATLICTLHAKPAVDMFTCLESEKVTEECAPSCVTPAVPLRGPTIPACCITPYWEFDGEALDFRKGGGGLLFMPVWQCPDKLIFFQAHGGFYRDHLYNGSIGFGLRQKLFPYVGLGINAFFDMAHSDKNRSYLQGGAGAELFGPFWIARINGYVPTLKSEFLNLEPIVSGNQIAIGGLREKSYGGLDMEVGASCPTVYGELWGFAGFYWFDACHAKAIVGPRLRTEWRVFDLACCYGTQLTIGGSWSYDHLHRGQGQLLLRIRVPFGNGCKRDTCSTKSRFCRQMGDPIRRENSIWVERNVSVARRNEGGQQLATIWFGAATDGGAGTQRDPASIAQINELSGPNDIIFLLPYNGPIRGPTLELKPNQRLASFGEGSQIQLDLPNRESITIYRTEGLARIRATLLPSSDGVAVHAAPDSQVQSIGIEGGRIGILADLGGSISIQDSVFNHQSHAAVVATDGDSFKMSGNSINRGSNGVRLRGYSTVDVANNLFSHISGNALWFEDSPHTGSIHVEKNRFQNSSNSVHTSGRAPGHIAFLNNTINASGGLSYASTSKQYTPTLFIDSNTFEGIPLGLTAASIQGNPVHLTLTNNHISNSTDAYAGFLLATGSDHAIIADNTLSDLGRHAIAIRNELTLPSQSLKLLIDGNTIANIGQSALYYTDSRLTAGRAHLTLRNNTISHTGVTKSGAPAVDIQTTEHGKDRISLSLINNRADSPTALNIHAAPGPIIDLYPSNDPELIRTTHNDFDGTVEIDGHVGQLANPPPAP